MSTKLDHIVTVTADKNYTFIIRRMGTPADISHDFKTDWTTAEFEARTAAKISGGRFRVEAIFRRLRKRGWELTFCKPIEIRVDTWR